MKNFILSCLLLIMGYSVAVSQIVQEGNRPMSQGSNNAFFIELPNTNSKDVEKAWFKHVKDLKGKTKKDRKTNEIFTDNAVLREMGNNDFDVYAYIEQKAEDTEVTVWFDLGGAYLSSSAHPERYKVAEELLQDFAKRISMNMLEDLLKDEEKALKRLESDLKKLEKDKEDYLEAIERAKAAIKQAESDIEENQEAQKNKVVEIEQQQQRLKEVEEELKKIKN